MHSRFFILAALVLGLGAQAPAQRPPNIVLVMMDDLGYGDLASYGASDVRTPNIDRLAREGVRLTDAYANGPVCTPTRAALISGRYPQRDGLEWALTISPEDRELGLRAEGTSLPALLKTSGYATGLFGKWHLGWKPEFGPLAHGFDEFYGFLSGAHSYYTKHAEILNRGSGAPDLFENTTPVEATGYLTDEITRRAVGFIARHAERPFFLEVAYNAVHWPFEPPDRPPTEDHGTAARSLRQMPDDSVPATRQDYVRILQRADQGVGQILAALEQRGLTNNTLVIFTNDNGGEWLSRNAPLFHRKGTLWEGGIRVPLILRWPGELAAGKVSGQVAITTDITASILAAAGARTPSNYRQDGIDILPILRGKAPLVERRLFWRFDRRHRQQRAVRLGQWKLLVDANQLLLFDLSVDPGERIDLAARRPDLVASLKQLLAAWEVDVDEGRRSRITAPAAPSPASPATAPPVATDSTQFVLLQYPGGRETIGSAINARGEVVGRYDTPDGRTHGFIWRDGRFESVHLPGAEFTMIRGLNDRGDRVGAARAPGGRNRAYVQRAGAVIYLDVPNARNATGWRRLSRRVI